MSKTLMYIVAAVVFLGIGALVTGLIMWSQYPEPNKEEMIKESRFAQCDLQYTITAGAVNGTLYLKQHGPSSPVIISGNITGLEPGPHGFHVHQFGVFGASKQCKDAGGHYNPLNFNHSAPNSTKRHMGDLGNIEAVEDEANTSNTMAKIAITDNILKMYDPHSIIGRSIVVHEGPDDLGKGGTTTSVRSGSAGGRVACCTIYATKQQ